MVDAHHGSLSTSEWRSFVGRTMLVDETLPLTAAAHVTVHLRGDDDDTAWRRLAQLVGILGHDPTYPLCIGYFVGGEARWAAEKLTPSPTHVTLEAGTDWDWLVWSITLADAQECYFPERFAWPNLIFASEGKWILESPPAINETYLYPARPPR